MIYHWTSKEKAATAVKKLQLSARRWQHFLEHEQRFAKGSSWSEHPTLWQRDNEVCLVVDESKLQNRLHHINGNRTFLLTMGMDPGKNYDPNAYKYESTVPDEVFVEGSIDLTNTLIEVKVLDCAQEYWARLFADDKPPPNPSPSDSPRMHA